jgi:hypothetical protein
MPTQRATGLPFPLVLIVGTARVKLPEPMIPPSNNAHEGWITVTELFMDENQITGHLRINAFNKPNVKIDRRTGGITLEHGLSEFAGQCDAIAKDAPRRF